MATQWNRIYAQQSSLPIASQRYAQPVYDDARRNTAHPARPPVHQPTCPLHGHLRDAPTHPAFPQEYGRRATSPPYPTIHTPATERARDAIPSAPPAPSAQPAPPTPVVPPALAAPRAPVVPTAPPAPLPKPEPRDAGFKASRPRARVPRPPRCEPTPDRLEAHDPPSIDALDISCADPRGRGLLHYKKWWFLRKVGISVRGKLLFGTPIFLRENTLRVINAKHSYIIPIGCVEYIRTSDGLDAACAHFGIDPQD